ncbi:hypothetical protein FACS1894180_4560 [Bacteroidia bacterium]|nr:hypothetical protein FACS1894180_4560 [Bacteroidia bacterium]
MDKRIFQIRYKLYQQMMLIIFVFLQFSALLWAQANDNESTSSVIVKTFVELVKDLDGDMQKDTVYTEYVLSNDASAQNYSRIVYRLSSQNFQKIQSQKIKIDYWGFPEIESGITSTKNGFEFFVNYTRNGNKAQFRYDKQAKKIRLIGMARYEIGTFDRNGEGKSSVNLLTNQYIGEWYAVDYNLEKLFKIPTIKSKMFFGKIYLDDFSEETFSDYAQKCSNLRYKHKIKIISTR